MRLFMLAEMGATTLSLLMIKMAHPYLLKSDFGMIFFITRQHGDSKFTYKTGLMKRLNEFRVLGGVEYVIFSTFCPIFPCRNFIESTLCQPSKSKLVSGTVLVSSNGRRSRSKRYQYFVLYGLDTAHASKFGN